MSNNSIEASNNSHGNPFSDDVIAPDQATLDLKKKARGKQAELSAFCKEIAIKLGDARLANLSNFRTRVDKLLKAGFTKQEILITVNDWHDLTAPDGREFGASILSENMFSTLVGKKPKAQEPELWLR